MKIDNVRQILWISYTNPALKDGNLESGRNLPINFSFWWAPLTSTRSPVYRLVSSRRGKFAPVGKLSFLSISAETMAWEADSIVIYSIYV